MSQSLKNVCHKGNNLHVLFLHDIFILSFYEIKTNSFFQTGVSRNENNIWISLYMYGYIYITIKHPILRTFGAEIFIKLHYSRKLPLK